MHTNQCIGVINIHVCEKRQRQEAGRLVSHLNPFIGDKRLHHLFDLGLTDLVEGMQHPHNLGQDDFIQRQRQFPSIRCVK